MDSPKKKRVSALVALMDMDLNCLDQGESSSDESFKIENHNDSDDNDDSSGSDMDDDETDDDENSSEDDELAPKKSKADSDDKQEATTSKDAKQLSTQQLIDQSKAQASETPQIKAKPVCCACLGDRSDDSNEIVECDGCKVTVHEGCYGVSESISVSSTISSCSTEPWFCEACKANVKDPDCELCPNKGGIFKETDCGRWVHLVCALYVPGVAFGEVDQLSMVTLFEMQYNKWGSKKCSLCDDDKFAWTGVCIGCDAGMCKTFFHVTCAQKDGLLSEAHHDEVDPFYAHCKLHSEKSLVKNRKRNHNAFQVQMKRNEIEMANNMEKLTPEQERIQRKLGKHRIKYSSNKTIRPEPWVPTQKMPRKLLTSASACKKLARKSELMGINTKALEFEEAQIASLHDIRKKWHIPPAFSVEFVGYYLDRSTRLQDMKENLQKQTEINKSLVVQQQTLRTKYDDLAKVKEDVCEKQKDLIDQINFIHDAIHKIMPNKQLPSIEMIGRPILTPAAVKMIPSPVSVPTLSSTPPPQLITGRMTVPTAAARKMGVGFPLNHHHKDDTGRVLSTQRSSNDDLLNECGICKKCVDQHMLVKCDNCHLYYHLNCLNPPLTRHPKKSKTYSWQCSECDKSDGSASENMIIPKGPRRSRVRYSKDGPIFNDPLRDSFGSDRSMLSKKSDDSFKKLNGSETDLSIMKIAIDPVPMPTTTSTPLEKAANVVAATTNVVKKRVRKAKPKKTAEENHVNENSTTIQPELNELKTEISESSAAQSPDETAKKRRKKTVKKEVVKENSNVTNETTFSSESSALEITSTPTTVGGEPGKPKKGRPPKKPKPSITQITNNLQLKQNQLKPPLSVMDIRKLTENCLPQVNEISKIDESNGVDVATGISSSIESVVNGSAAYLNGDSTPNLAHHKHKKRKSHKRRHSKSPSSGDVEPGLKKHKRKRKHKSTDDATATDASTALSQTSQNDALSSARSPEQPRIKMKIKKVVGNNTNFMCSLPSPTGSEPHPEINQSNLTKFTNKINKSAATMPIKLLNGHMKKVTKAKKIPLNKASAAKKKKEIQLLNANLNQNHEIASSFSETITTSQPIIETAVMNKTVPLTNSQCCDVCTNPGTKDNMVKCDECKKSYHFDCLSPPVTKTPKKRGYSWHCSDCFSDNEADNLIRIQASTCPPE